MPRSSDIPEALPDAHAPRTTGTRRLTVDGQQWSVREVIETRLDRRGGSCLCFEGPHGTRCVRGHPPDWQMLSDEDLYRLSLNVRRPLRSG